MYISDPDFPWGRAGQPEVVQEVLADLKMKLRKQSVTLSTQVGHPNVWTMEKNKKNLVCEICELHLMKIHTKKVGDTVEAGGASKWFGQCERTPAHIINNLSTGLLLNTRCTLYIDHILIGWYKLINCPRVWGVKKVKYVSGPKKTVSVVGRDDKFRKNVVHRGQ